MQSIVLQRITALALQATWPLPGRGRCRRRHTTICERENRNVHLAHHAPACPGLRGRLLPVRARRAGPGHSRRCAG
ncbi:hypothetical protein DB811_24280, partial [Xanthomonas perforans]